MARTTSNNVSAILLEDYDTNNSLTPFIETASTIVDTVNNCASLKGISLSSTQLELIERWLAAHYYVMSDQNYRSKRTEGASAVYQGETGKYFEASKYGQTALSIDYSGCLKSLMNPRVGVYWLGKELNEQQTYNQRN